MALTGVKLWPGMDVLVYQEVCGGRPWKTVGLPQGDEKRAGLLGGTKRPAVCWQFNEGSCSYGRTCRFPHVCEVCIGIQGNYRGEGEEPGRSIPDGLILLLHLPGQV